MKRTIVIFMAILGMVGCKKEEAVDSDKYKGTWKVYEKCNGALVPTTYEMIIHQSQGDDILVENLGDTFDLTNGQITKDKLYIALDEGKIKDNQGTEYTFFLEPTEFISNEQINFTYKYYIDALDQTECDCEAFKQ